MKTVKLAAAVLAALLCGGCAEANQRLKERTPELVDAAVDEVLKTKEDGTLDEIREKLKKKLIEKLDKELGTEEE